MRCDGVILQGDCLDLMPTLDAESIDAVVTDPPYGLSFMGKDWDHGVPGVAFWIEALRVAKPGAHLMAFGGTRTFHRLTVAIEDAGWEIRDCLGWLYGSGFPKSHNIGAGRGTALKPAWEPVILARKPLIGTVANNVLRYGTGAINIDGCRVEGAPPSVPQPIFNSPTGRTYGMKTGEGRNGEMSHAQGRWPANILHDGSDEVVGVFPETEPSKPGLRRNQNTGWACSSPPTDIMVNYNDSGSAARFFYCAKASRSERDEGNVHPTVKPLALMRYLCRLITPSGGTVLDPFMGSGSTGKAAVLEGFEFIGIELNPEYVDIAERRIGAVNPLLAAIGG
jgi:site-specific DNA-methyltransferase (adenine-specific)